MHGSDERSIDQRDTYGINREQAKQALRSFVLTVAHVVEAVEEPGGPRGGGRRRHEGRRARAARLVAAARREACGRRRGTLLVSPWLHGVAYAPHPRSAIDRPWRTERIGRAIVRAAMQLASRTRDRAAGFNSRRFWYNI